LRRYVIQKDQDKQLVFYRYQSRGRVCQRIRGQVLHEQRIGISQNYLSTVERGKVRIGSEILARISREFGKSIEWLLTGEDQKSTREER
jgi:Helix-turn-helix